MKTLADAEVLRSLKRRLRTLRRGYGGQEAPRYDVVARVGPT
jgi:hypothetical protein